MEIVYFETSVNTRFQLLQLVSNTLMHHKMH